MRPICHPPLIYFLCFSSSHSLFVSVMHDFCLSCTLLLLRTFYILQFIIVYELSLQAGELFTAQTLQSSRSFKVFQILQMWLYCLHLFGAFWIIIIRIYVRFFDSLYLTKLKEIEISEYYRYNFIVLVLLKLCVRLTMSIGEIFDYLYSSRTKNFESLHSNESRSMTSNLLVFWSSIIVASCFLQCFGWTWSYLIQVEEFGIFKYHKCSTVFEHLDWKVEKFTDTRNMASHFRFFGYRWWCWRRTLTPKFFTSSSNLTRCQVLVCEILVSTILWF